ncbi:MAG: hypothetical protein JAZ11_02750 [Candidatus Thiodiazotropha lotti]|nr:hypothetical protein [Candidatus Thiodiazotropha lotti]
MATKPKIPRNLELALILFVGVIMMVGFLFKGWSDAGGQNKKEQVTNDKESAPDPNALLSEIKRQNDAALRAKEALLKKERELKRAKRELQEKERGHGQQRQNSKGGSKQDDKAKERKEAAAISEVIALRGGNKFGVSFSKQVGTSALAQQGSSRSGNTPASSSDSGFEDRYKSIRDALGQGGKQDDRPMNQRWMDRMANGNKEQQPVRSTAAHQGTVIHEGTSVSAVLMTRIDSDLPGLITARVLHNIYDTQTGLVMAIPAGSRLIGRYNSATEAGQSRVMAAFHRVILPDGRSLYLKGVGGIGDQGAPGIPGKVDSHFWELLGTNLLVATATWAMESADTSASTTINVGGGSGSGSAYGEIMVDMAKQLTKPYADRKPTIKVEPGATFSVMINQDIVLSRSKP